MSNSRRITSNCEHCGHLNEVSLGHFAGAENIFESCVIATCQSCERDIVVELYQADIH